MTRHRANCADCAWSEESDDLVEVTDAMERHTRKEIGHDVDLERAVATDGGWCTDDAGGELLINRVVTGGLQALQIPTELQASWPTPAACVPSLDVAQCSSPSQSPHYISYTKLGLCSPYWQYARSGQKQVVQRPGGDR